MIKATFHALKNAESIAGDTNESKDLKPNDLTTRSEPSDEMLDQTFSIQA